MPVDRLDGVLGTGGGEAAGGRQQWRQEAFVRPQKNGQDPGGPLSGSTPVVRRVGDGRPGPRSGGGRPFHALPPCRSRAAISCSRVAGWLQEKSGRTVTTISLASGNTCRCRRKTSRKSRFMRLRRTAEPARRCTLIPSRRTSVPFGAMMMLNPLPCRLFPVLYTRWNSRFRRRRMERGKGQPLCTDLRRQLPAPLGPSSPDNGLSRTGTHADQKTMGAGACGAAGLKSSFTHNQLSFMMARLRCRCSARLPAAIPAPLEQRWSGMRRGRYLQGCRQERGLDGAVPKR